MTDLHAIDQDHAIQGIKQVEMGVICHASGRLDG